MPQFNTGCSWRCFKHTHLCHHCLSSVNIQTLILINTVYPASSCPFEVRSRWHIRYKSPYLTGLCERWHKRLACRMLHKFGVCHCRTTQSTVEHRRHNGSWLGSYCQVLRSCRCPQDYFRCQNLPGSKIWWAMSVWEFFRSFTWQYVLCSTIWLCTTCQTRCQLCQIYSNMRRKRRSCV